MSNKQTLMDLIQSKHFDAIEKAFRNHFDLPLETIDINGKPVKSLCSDHYQPRFCGLLCGHKIAKNRCLQDRLRNLKMAFETGQPYTTLCHAGIFTNCVPLMNNDQPLGGIILARSLPEDFQDGTKRDIRARFIGVQINPEELYSAARELPVLSPRFIHNALEMLFILVYDRTGLDPRVIQWKRQKTHQQAQIGDGIQQQKLSGFTRQYPFESERELLAKVKIGDKTGAREILNSILANILFSSPGQLNILKVRLVELLSILSRSASESGVDPDILLKKNIDYINKVISLESQDDICAWISLALNDFIDCVYELNRANKNTRLKPALEYMQKHYKDKITLEDIAKSAHLSASRLCHLFREQLGTTIFKYLANIRVQRAKYLLLSTDMTCIEICFDSGFSNLSFFNRTFKMCVGITPTKFRSQNQR